MRTIPQLFNLFRHKLLVHTPHGSASPFVPEFDPATYKGLKSGLGRTRRSSKHFECKDKCCVDGARYHQKREK